MLMEFWLIVTYLLIGLIIAIMADNKNGRVKLLRGAKYLIVVAWPFVLLGTLYKLIVRGK